MDVAVNSIDHILGALPGLGSAELAEVEKRIAFLRRTSEPARDDAVGFAHLVVDVIVEVLGNMGVPQPRHFTNLQSRSDWQAFADKVKVIEKFMMRSGLDRQGRLAVMRIGVRLLVKRLMAEGRQVSFNVVLSNAHRISVMLNREFPGYGQNGLLHVLVNRPVLTEE